MGGVLKRDARDLPPDAGGRHPGGGSRMQVVSHPNAELRTQFPRGLTFLRLTFPLAGRRWSGSLGGAATRLTTRHFRRLQAFEQLVRARQQRSHCFDQALQVVILALRRLHKALALRSSSVFHWLSLWHSPPGLDRRAIPIIQSPPQPDKRGPRHMVPPKHDFSVSLQRLSLAESRRLSSFAASTKAVQPLAATAWPAPWPPAGRCPPCPTPPKSRRRWRCRIVPARRGRGR